MSSNQSRTIQDLNPWKTFGFGSIFSTINCPLTIWNWQFLKYYLIKNTYYLQFICCKKKHLFISLFSYIWPIFVCNCGMIKLDSGEIFVSPYFTHFINSHRACIFELPCHSHTPIDPQRCYNNWYWDWASRTMVVLEQTSEWGWNKFLLPAQHELCCILEFHLQNLYKILINYFTVYCYNITRNIYCWFKKLLVYSTPKNRYLHIYLLVLVDFQLWTWSWEEMIKQEQSSCD